MRSYAVQGAFHNVAAGTYTVRMLLLDAAGNILIVSDGEPFEVVDTGPEVLDADPPVVRPLREKPGQQPGHRPPKPPKPV